MAAVPLRFLLASFFTSILGEAQYVMQDATLVHYIDRRILSIEVCAILYDCRGTLSENGFDFLCLKSIWVFHQ